MATPAQLAADQLVAERLSTLRSSPAVQTGPAWFHALAEHLAKDTAYPLDKASALLGKVAEQQGIGNPTDPRAARVAELRAAGRYASPIPRKSDNGLVLRKLPQLTGNVQRDQRLIELHVAALAVSR
jgi:hypothetical protein